MKQPGQPPDRRVEPRATKLSDHMAEFKLTGVPIYQLKVRDLSAKGAGILARADSKILNMIRIGQELDVKLISFAETTDSSGHYRSRIEHSGYPQFSSNSVCQQGTDNRCSHLSVGYRL